MKRGQTLVEMMVGMGIAAAIMPAIVTSFFAARGGSAQEQVRMQSQGRLREAREVLRLLKQNNWASIAPTGTYGLKLASGVWSLDIPESNLDSLFSRQIIIGDAYRTPLNQLSTLAFGNTLDPSVRHVSVTVGWTTPNPSSVSSDYYLMRLENLTWLQTTVANFTAGTQTGTAITANEVGAGSGEVVLGSGGTALANWCDPSLTLATVDLPKSGVANAISAAVGSGTGPNQVIAGTGDNASGVSLGHVTITNTTPPSTTGVDGTFDGYKTNGVFVIGNRAYVTTDTNSEDVVVLDLSNIVGGKYTKLGAYNAPPNNPNNSSAVYVSGSIGFMTIGNRLDTFDVNTRTLLSSITLGGVGSKLVVSGSYAYVAESSGSRSMEIVQFSADGRTLSIAGYVSISGQNGVAVVINSTASRAYLATAQGKVYILNISTPTSPSSVGIYDTNGMTPKDVTVVTNNKAIVVGTGGAIQYQVMDIVNEATPVSCGGLAIASGVNGIASVQEEDGDTYSYIITGDATSELKIIQGGTGGGGGTYALDGTFESSIFDPGYSVVFNRFDTANSTPVDTSIEYQVAITNKVSGTCAGASYTFVGPDKLSTSRFTSSSQIPVGSGVGFNNPGECLKYKAYLHTSSSNSTPILYDITFNYSP